MKLLLDTNVLLWCLKGRDHIPVDAEFMIVDPGNTIYYSAASLWEISIKHKAHPDQMLISGEKAKEYFDASGFVGLDITMDHIFAVDTLELDPAGPRHQDPFDRLLLAQAKTENMIFITADKRLKLYNEKAVKTI